MRARLLAGFSLMEMMVVLLIVAIIAAASAPMVSKKMSRGSSGESPWVFTGLGNNIAYNMSGDANSSAIIGSSRYTRRDGNSPTNPRLVIASGNDTNHPALAFADSTGTFSGQINMNAATGVVTMNDQSVGNNSVAIGLGQSITNSPSGTVAIGRITNENGSIDTVGIGNGVTNSGSYSVAIGSGSVARGVSSVALGSVAPPIPTVASGRESVALGVGSFAEGDNSIAIGAAHFLNNPVQTGGTRTRASGDMSIAIGISTFARHSRGTAIGAGASTTEANQIVLGTPQDTVYIPGHLIVGGNSVLGLNGSSRVFLNVSDSNGGNGIVMVGSGRIDNHVLDAQATKTNSGTGTTYSTAKSWFSDRRLKNVGEKYTAGLAELKKLDFFHYTFKKDKSKTPRVGVMAQDLQKVFPDAVVKGEDGYLRIRLEDMFYAVINAVKELDNKILSVSNNITAIKTLVEKQNETIKVQQRTIKELQKQNEDFEKRLKYLEKHSK